MTTEREKIIQLVTQCFPMDIRRGLCFDDAEAFYKAAQAEAHEEDAKLCEYLPVGCGLEGRTFADAIRKKAREK